MAFAATELAKNRTTGWRRISLDHEIPGLDLWLVNPSERLTFWLLWQQQRISNSFWMNSLSKVAYWLFDPVVAMGSSGGVFSLRGSCGEPAEKTCRAMKAKTAPKTLFLGRVS